LQKKLNPATGTLKLDDKDLADIPHYAFDYQQGGFETRLLSVFSRLLGPRLGRED
jgi:hypothetical protein